MEEDLARYADGWRERKAARDRLCRKRERLARELLPRLAAILRERYGAARVWVFGSLVTGSFGLDSDIDLAVEGLPRDALFRAGAEVEREAGEFRVDLIPVEEAHEHVRARIFQEGVLIPDEQAR